MDYRDSPRSARPIGRRPTRRRRREGRRPHCGTPTRPPGSATSPAACPSLSTRAQAAADATTATTRTTPARRVLGLTYQLAATQLTKLGESRPGVDRRRPGARRRPAHRRPAAPERSSAPSPMLFRPPAATAKPSSSPRTPPPTSSRTWPIHLLRCSPSTARSSWPARWPPPGQTTRAPPARSSQQPTRPPAGSATTPTTSGPRSARQTSPSIASPPPPNSATSRSPSTSALASTPASMPMERRVRHALEVARALQRLEPHRRGAPTLLEAEQMAPEQVRYHFLSRQLVLTWVRQQRGKPSPTLVDLARRLDVLE